MCRVDQNAFKNRHCGTNRYSFEGNIYTFQKFTFQTGNFHLNWRLHAYEYMYIINN